MDITKLKTLPNFGRLKDLSKQRVHQLVRAGRFDTIEIDGVKFIVMNDKATKYIKQF